MNKISVAVSEIEELIAAIDDMPARLPVISPVTLPVTLPVKFPLKVVAVDL